MKILLVDNGTTLLSKLEKLIPEKEVVVRVDDLNREMSDDFDLVILSGSSKYSVMEDVEKFVQEIDLIKNTQKPLIGICFGFELIVKAFGGSLKRLEVKDKGIQEIEILDKKLSDKPVVSVYESHRWEIEKLPGIFNVLARSKTGPEIIKHKNLPIYGFQFHPENFVDETDGDEVFTRVFSYLNSPTNVGI